MGTVAELLSRDGASFHHNRGAERNWNALPGTLRAIERLATGATLETGSGASTVVFAATAERHTAISPSDYEHQRIINYCESINIPTRHVTFHASKSQDVLPTLAPDPLDFVLIDGAHSFPWPTVDWCYTQRRLRPGGMMLLDDVPIPAVSAVWRAMAMDEAHWQLIETIDDRAALFLKLDDLPPGDKWQDQPFNRRYPIVRTLPWSRRAPVLTREWSKRTKRRLANRIR